MSQDLQTLRLMTVELRNEQDVVLARQRAREVAEVLGFERQGQTRLATALSEIARNAYQYAGGGEVEFSLQTEAEKPGRKAPRQSLVMVVRDSGPGIARLEEILAGRYRSSSGMGLGIIGTRRLLDQVEVTSSPTGTSVQMLQHLPTSAPLCSGRRLQEIAAELAGRGPAGLLEEVQVQNQELLRAAEETQQRQDELARVNEELAETNTGVLALYDELETLHRIGGMLASKLELRPLIQSIVDVTTTLTDAQVGAFFLREETGERWELYATSGERASSLEGVPANDAADFFGTDFAGQGIAHVPNLLLHKEPCSASKFAAAVRGRMAVQSCLTVPVVESNGRVLGALLFASETPGAFSERSERILASVSTQAAVGIEKARLFQSVSVASEAKDRFFATLSHELRTPLNPAMAIISSLLGDPRVPPELQEDLAAVWRNIRLEARLIDDLLDFNRLIKGKLQLSTDALDMNPLIESVVEICRDDLEAKAQTLQVELAAHRTRVVGDAARLQQVLWNVVKNAIKFTPAQGSITIRTSAPGETLRVEVTDTGRGIEAGALESIFSAFDQGESQVAGHFGGLGLGLSIARMFMELHGGRIAAASSGAGRGTTITIELPLTEAPLTSELEVAPPPAPALPARSGRILLVDDHADTLIGLKRLLERRGFTVSGAASGADALALVQAETFDLLVSDLGLPDVSGHELLHRLRAHQEFPAIAMSGYGMESDVAASRVAGFDVHITKPVDFGQLMGAIRSVLPAEP